VLTDLTFMTRTMALMVMKQPMSSAPIRVSVAQAKSQLSRLLRTVDRQPVVIHNRGRDVATLHGATRGPAAEPPFVAFFERLEGLRRRLKMKGVDFDPARVVIRPADPFGTDP
jgi:antitoxin (DNA-binding transcriptional repressor) of toxin-antitoxin stability system